MDFKKLEDIYKYMRPADLHGGSLRSPTQKEEILDILSKMIMSPRGEIYSSRKIFDDVENHFKKVTTAVSSKEKTGMQFHAIGTSRRLDLADADYWSDNENKKVEKLSDIIGNVGGKNFETTVFVSRSPHLTPASRGTDNVDFFLNYTPPIVAASMVPYLEVEFQLQGDPNSSVNTPGVLKFLIGVKDNLSVQDRVIKDSDVFSPKNQEESYVVSGMEMFLMPQTLTNMDDLMPHKGRLVRAKPFLPFASLQGFDITIANAGAGNFAHKKGTLKFVIHDKARISEIAEFIKGSSGFNKAVIWTTYGWVAPMNRMQEDDYAKFINESMIIRECWSVVNSQFSFDAAGQVTMNLELVSRAAKALESLTVDEVSGEIKDFHKVIKTIAEIKNKLVGENKFAISVTADQLLNAASTSGFLNQLNKGEIKKTIEQLKENLKYSSLLPDQTKELSDKLDSLTDSGKFSWDKVNKSIGTSVINKFNVLGTGRDPFLVSSGTKSKYFSDATLLKSVIDFNGKHTQRLESIKKSTTTPESLRSELNKGIEVVSFGKLFTSFVAPRVAESDSCDELQIFFYGMNDECGPMSGQSIAEFPINLTSLKYAYAEAIKRTGLESLTIQAFLRLIIETQFSDQRAIGYGMNSYFVDWDPEKPNEMKRIENNSLVEKGMSSWISRYGSLKLPVIEMFVENGVEGDAVKYTVEQLKKSATRLYYEESKTRSETSGSKKIIKRIHIYDRANNPYRLTQQIIDSGSDFEVAEVLTGPADEKLRDLVKNMDAGRRKKLQEDLNSGVNYNTALSNVGVDQQAINNLVVIKRQGADKILIPKDRKRLKDYLMSTVPCIFVGTNGTMVMSINASSATSGLQGAINIMNASKSAAKGQATAPDNPLEEVGGLPLRTVPIQLTMTTMGVPIASLYQTYFVDFETGTSLDNIYNCTQLQHSITPGKFTTNWTFMYASGYGKFTAPPSVVGLMNQRAKAILNEAVSASAPKQNNGNKPK